MLKELLFSLSFLQLPDMLLAQQVETVPSSTIIQETAPKITKLRESILPTATDCYAGGKELVENNKKAKSESIYKYSPEQLSKISPSFQGLIDASVYQDHPEARKDIELLIQYVINFQQQSGVMIQGAQGYDVNAIGLSNHNILPSNDDQYGTIKGGQISPYRLKSAIMVPSKVVKSARID